MAGSVPNQHYARRPIGYNGVHYDWGQVFKLSGAINDEKLVRLGYISELGKNAETYECSECGASFIGIAERNNHGSKRHRDRDENPEEEDRRLEREERMLEQVAPLNLEKTQASSRG